MPDPVSYNPSSLSSAGFPERDGPMFGIGSVACSIWDSQQWDLRLPNVIGLAIRNLFLTLDFLAKLVYRGGEGSIWSYGSSICPAMLMPFGGLPLSELL